MLARKHSLHIITTGRQELEQVLAILNQCRTEWIDALHIREKHRGARELVRWYHALKTVLPASALIVNDRLDAAMASGADGVQLTGTSLTPGQARLVAPDSMLIGCSVHSEQEAADAARQGADYVLFGHIYRTASKEGMEPRGLEALRRTVDASPIPVIAIGGITPDKVDDVLSTGCAGIAVLSAVFCHENPGGQLASFREALNRTPYTPKSTHQRPAASGQLKGGSNTYGINQS